MNKKTFLRILKKGLYELDDIDRSTYLSFYQERFDEGKLNGLSEEEIVESLEDPNDIVNNILEDYTPTGNTKRNITSSQFDVSRLIVIILFDIFVASWVYPTVLAIDISFGAVAISMLAAPIAFFTNSIINAVLICFAALGVFVLFFMITLYMLELTWLMVKWLVRFHYSFLEKDHRFADGFENFSFLNLWKKHDVYIKYNPLFYFVASTVLILVCSVGLVISLSVNEDTEYLNVQEEIVFDSYESISIEIDDNSSLDFEIIKSDVSVISYDYTYAEDNKGQFTIDKTNSIVEFSNSNSSFPFFEFNINDLYDLINSRDNTLIIYVPEDNESISLVIDGVNMDINIDGIDFTEFEIDCTNTDILLNNVNIDSSFNLDTTNADLKFDAVSITGEMNIYSTNIDLVIDNTTIVEDITIDSTNLEMSMNNVNIEKDIRNEMFIDSVNCEIEFDNVYIAGLDIDTVNAELEYHNDDSTYTLDYLKIDSVNTSKNINVPINRLLD